MPCTPVPFQAIVPSTASAPPEPSTDPFAVDAEDAAMPDQAPAPAAAPGKQKAPAQSDQAILGFRQTKSDKGFVKLDKTKILFEGEPFSRICEKKQNVRMGVGTMAASREDAPTGTADA
jgi:hypothetical protein